MNDDVTLMPFKGKDNSGSEEGNACYHKICNSSHPSWREETMKRRIIVGIHYCSNEHQRDCDKEKLLSVIATEYSWIAASFYDSAGKYKLDVNHVSSVPLCNGLRLYYIQNLDGKRQEVRFLFLTTPNRKLPETSENTRNCGQCEICSWQLKRNGITHFLPLLFYFSHDIKTRGNFQFAVYLNSKESLWSQTWVEYFLTF